MSAVRAVIFDLDGTLADTLRDIGEAMNRTLAARGFPGHAITDYRRLIGHGARELARRALPPHAQQLADAIVAEFRRDYFARPIVHSRPYPGMPALLEVLTQRSIPMAVLSNKMHEPTVQIVTELFPDTPFVAVVGERPPTPRKPDPTSALALAEQLGVPPGACALIGDSDVDVRTAVAAGMQPVAVLWGFQDRDQLEQAGATKLLREPAELLEALAARPAPAG